MPHGDRWSPRPPNSPSLTLSQDELANSPQFVLKDRPALNGTEITNPQQQFDPTTNQPNVTFDFTGERAVRRSRR